jgi:hypothetical protein
VLAVYAAESLLLAFALKLRVSAALAGQRGPRPAAPAAAAALGLDDASFHKAASFLGQCMPTYVAQPGVGRPALKVTKEEEGVGAGCHCRCYSSIALFPACSHPTVLHRVRPKACLLPARLVRGLQGAAGAALTRLSQDGLAWVPTCCNLAALLCFGLCLTLNSAVTGGQPAAILLLAPLLLLLAQDPLLLRWLEERRRYLPSAAAVTAYLAATAIWQLVGEVADDLPLSSEMWWYAAKHLGCLAAVLPCQLYLLAWLWNKRQVGEGGFPSCCSWCRCCCRRRCRRSTTEA